jgi:serine/threonine-protein phosphatase PP1 catalytic subunit
MRICQQGYFPLIMLVYGFFDECKRRANVKVFREFISVFDCLPIAAIISKRIFCVHGGLSPDLRAMDDIRKLQRPTEIPLYGLLSGIFYKS